MWNRQTGCQLSFVPTVEVLLVLPARQPLGGSVGMAMKGANWEDELFR